LAIHAAQAAMCHGKPGPDAKPNNMPIFTGAPVFVKSVTNGKLYTVGSGDDQVPVVHLWGTPYQKGFAHGTLMKDRATALLNGVWAYLESEVEQALNSSIIPPSVQKWIADVGLGVALDATLDMTRNFTGKYFFDEIKGMADATGMDAQKISRIHMIGELTKGRCSMFGAWGKALLAKNGLLTLRALDWAMDGPFRNFPEVTVYHAQNSNENTFLNLGWTGWIGSISGVSDQQLSIHEIGVAFPDDSFGGESRIGVPFTYVLRDILQFDKTQKAGVQRLQTANRTAHLILGVGGGKERVFNSIEYSHDVCIPMDDTNMKPVADWHPNIENVVYHGMDWLCPSFNQVLGTQLKTLWGNLTAESAIRDVMSITQTGDLHIYVTDLVGMTIWFANAAKDGAAGPASAYDRSYIRMDLKTLFAVTP
jgi:hypothetical protein